MGDTRCHVRHRQQRQRGHTAFIGRPGRHPGYAPGAKARGGRGRACGLSGSDRLWPGATWMLASPDLVADVIYQMKPRGLAQAAGTRIAYVKPRMARWY